jgi:hypothetical protein
LKRNFKNFPVSILDARQQTIPKAFPGYDLAFAETSGFEAATRCSFNGYLPAVIFLIAVIA